MEIDKTFKPDIVIYTINSENNFKEFFDEF